MRDLRGGPHLRSSKAQQHDEAASPAGRAIARALTLSYGVGVLLAVWGTLAGPFNALGWIAVAFNLVLSVAFGYLATSPISSASA